MLWVCTSFFCVRGFFVAPYTRGESCGPLSLCFKVEEMAYVWLCALLVALIAFAQVLTSDNKRQDGFIPTGEHICMRMQISAFVKKIL